MELEAGSEIMKCFKDQGVKWLFLKVWGKIVKVTKPQGAKRKFTLFIIFIIQYIYSNINENGLLNYLLQIVCEVQQLIIVNKMEKRYCVMS
ncbi:hypothetical protein Hanom_Chr03g00206741 [Helianthus anomalus]